jgi:phosphoserine phosphatase
MKLLVCDVEGTIFKAQYKIKGTDYASTMWQPIAQRLGDAAIQAERDTHIKWENGEYKTYRDWVNATVQIHKDFGLHRDTFNDLINGAEFNDGVVEFFDQLDRDEYTPVLVSGGFQELIRRAQKELNINHGVGACEYIFHDEDGLLVNHALNSCDFEGKYDYIKMLFSDYGLNAKEDWVFIGDGKNDKHIAQKAPLSFGINAHPELKAVVHHEVACFSEIASILSRQKRPISSREKASIDGSKATPKTKNERLTEEEKLRLENIKLKEKITSLDSKIKRLRHKKDLKEQIFDNMLQAEDGDYTAKPIISLKSLLNECKVVFFGSKKERKVFQFFDNYHANLSVIEGVNDKFDLTPMVSADFVFTFNKCMSHTASWRTEVAKKILPYANLNHGNKDMLECAMANILYRYIFEEDG